jgi:hypothetical protein
MALLLGGALEPVEGSGFSDEELIELKELLADSAISTASLHRLILRRGFNIGLTAVKDFRISLCR